MQSTKSLLKQIFMAVKARSTQIWNSISKFTVGKTTMK